MKRLYRRTRYWLMRTFFARSGFASTLGHPESDKARSESIDSNG